jgi:hypothetical protein
VAGRSEAVRAFRKRPDEVVAGRWHSPGESIEIMKWLSERRIEHSIVGGDLFVKRPDGCEVAVRFGHWVLMHGSGQVTSMANEAFIARYEEHP